MSLCWIHRSTSAKEARPLPFASTPSHSRSRASRPSGLSTSRSENEATNSLTSSVGPTGSSTLGTAFDAGKACSDIFAFLASLAMAKDSPISVLASISASSKYRHHSPSNIIPPSSLSMVLNILSGSVMSSSATKPCFPTFLYPDNHSCSSILRSSLASTPALPPSIIAKASSILAYTHRYTTKRRNSRFDM